MKNSTTNRGALRPHYSGRAPPFLLAALVISLALLGFCYWNLSSQYNALETQYRELQERFRIFAEKKQSLENQYELVKKSVVDIEKKFESEKNSVESLTKDKYTLEKTVKSKQEEVDNKAKEIVNVQVQLEECNHKLNETFEKLTSALAHSAGSSNTVVKKPVFDNAAPKDKVAFGQRVENDVNEVPKENMSQEKEVKKTEQQQEEALDPDVHPKPQEAL